MTDSHSAGTPEPAPSNAKLRETVETLDSLAQEGFGTIGALAFLAYRSFETTLPYTHPEVIATVFRAIHSKAADIQNIINCEAEGVGCNFKDTELTRRYDARRTVNE